MAKRSISERQSVVEGEWVENEVPAVSFVQLVLTKDVTLTITGQITGEVYKFNGAGSTLYVDERDAEIMLTKRNGNPCCSGSMATPYFEKVG